MSQPTYVLVASSFKDGHKELNMSSANGQSLDHLGLLLRVLINGCQKDEEAGTLQCVVVLTIEL